MHAFMLPQFHGAAKAQTVKMFSDGLKSGVIRNERHARPYYFMNFPIHITSFRQGKALKAVSRPKHPSPNLLHLHIGDLLCFLRYSIGC